MTYAAIFLDRDGVLNNVVMKNGLPHPPFSVAELVVAEDAKKSLDLLKSSGYFLIGITNQPDVSRQITTIENVEKIHEKLMNLLPLDKIYTCFHDDKDRCDCRKPLPGLIIKAKKEYDIDLKQSFMIGDRWKDIAAGQQAGCKTIWLRTEYRERKPFPPADFTTSSLVDAAQWILNVRKENESSESVKS